MKTLFWKAYYRFVLGKTSYAQHLEDAMQTLHNVTKGSRGDMSQMYDMDGNQIRGWHKPRPAFARSQEHPLVTYYKNK